MLINKILILQKQKILIFGYGRTERKSHKSTPCILKVWPFRSFWTLDWYLSSFFYCFKIKRCVVKPFLLAHLARSARWAVGLVSEMAFGVNFFSLTLSLLMTPIGAAFCTCHSPSDAYTRCGKWLSQPRWRL